MIVLETCFFGCSLKICTFVCFVFYLIVSVYRFVNGIRKFTEFNICISLMLESRHVIWSFFLSLGIHGIFTNNVAYLTPCLWIQAIDLVEIITDYIGFIITKKIIIPSFGNSKKRFDDTYVRDVIIFTFIVALFTFLWIVVYSYFNQSKELEKSTKLPETHRPVLRENTFYRLEYSSYL